MEALVSPTGSDVVPVCSRYMQLLCSLRNSRPAMWFMVRTIENRSERSVSLGRYSQNSSPGIRVCATPYSPRIMSGACGLGSNVSC